MKLSAIAFRAGCILMIVAVLLLGVSARSVNSRLARAEAELAWIRLRVSALESVQAAPLVAPDHVHPGERSEAPPSLEELEARVADMREHCNGYGSGSRVYVDGKLTYFCGAGVGGRHLSTSNPVDRELLMRVTRTSDFVRAHGRLPEDGESIFKNCRDGFCVFDVYDDKEMQP